MEVMNTHHIINQYQSGEQHSDWEHCSKSVTKGKKCEFRAEID